MKFRLLVCFFSLVGFAATSAAYDPLYTVTLQPNPVFEVEGPQHFALYPFSEQMTAVVRKSKVRKVRAADATSLTIRSQRPKEVLGLVLQQISEQTGLKLSSSFNSTTPSAEPVYFRQAFSDTAVITLLLVPAGNDLYKLVCHYIIDERPAGSNDGTPEAIVEVKQLQQQIQDWQAQRKAGAAEQK